MRSLHADLLSKQLTGGQPANQVVFTSRDGATTYDYSFNPTLTTNRLEEIEAHWEPFDDYCVMILRNDDLAVPDITGYYVDLGMGYNTDSGLRYGTRPRLWIKKRHVLSGGGKEQKKDLKVILELEGVLNILKEQKVLIGAPPKYQDNFGELTGKTIYGMLEYLIETTLTLWTGITFTLDALGDQDDGIINTLVLEPVHNYIQPFLNPNAPNSFESYLDVFERLLAFTGCYLRPEASCAFKIVYPQSTDAVDETYYSSMADGHVFYEYTNRDYVKIPNLVKVFVRLGDTWDVSTKNGQATATTASHLIDTTKSQFIAGDVGRSVHNKTDDTWAEITAYTSSSDLTLSADIFTVNEQYEVFAEDQYIQGEAYSDDYDQTTWVFNGQYMPIIAIHTAGPVIATEANADALAKHILAKYQAETFGGRVVAPQDSRCEIYDNVQVRDKRGT